MPDTEETVDLPEDKLAGWERKEAVTGRPNDTPAAPLGPVRNSTLASRKNGTEDPEAPAPGENSTLAERAAARKKAVGSAQNKQVSSEDAEEKATPKRSRRKAS